jgi:hypothetical protein
MWCSGKLQIWQLSATCKPTVQPGNHKDKDIEKNEMTFDILDRQGIPPEIVGQTAIRMYFPTYLSGLRCPMSRYRHHYLTGSAMHDLVPLINNWEVRKH